MKSRLGDDSADGDLQLGNANAVNLGGLTLSVGSYGGIASAAGGTVLQLTRDRFRIVSAATTLPGSGGGSNGGGGGSRNPIRTASAR